jgi:hypothetical protein
MQKEHLLDSRFSGDTPVVEGYVFTMKVIWKSTTEQEGFAVNADPRIGQGADATGRNHFYLGLDNMIHVNASQPASATDPPIQ